MFDLPLPQTVVRLDIVKSSAGDRARQMHLDAGVQRVLNEVFAKIPERDPGTWFRRADGDSVTIVVPVTVPKAWLASDFVRMLEIGLRQLNRHNNADGRLRVRMAIANGEVALAPPNVAGPPVHETARLVDAEPLRKALDVRPKADLALIVSERFFVEVIRERDLDLDPSDFTEVLVVSKDFKGRGWIRKLTPDDGRGRHEDVAPPALPDLGPPPSSSQRISVRGDGNVTAGGNISGSSY